MTDDPNTPTEQPQSAETPNQHTVVMDSTTEQQFQPVVSQSEMPTVGSHKLFKTWLVVSFIILILNTALLSLTLIPFAGVFIALRAAPIFLATGLLGLANLFIVTRSVSQKYFSSGFKKITRTVLVLSAIAVFGGVSSPFILAVQHQEVAKAQKGQDKYNNALTEVSVQQAAELLRSCKIYSFNYSNPKGNDWEKTPEETSSGVLIFDEFTYMGEPTSSSWAFAKGKYVMYIADRTVDTLVPVARQAQQTCDIQFRHDNMDEQKKDGHWYFKDELVN